MSYVINIEMLLVLVQERPEIWDQRDGHYSNRARKEAAWRSICGILFPEYEQRPREVQRQIMEDVMRRWRSIRDQYRRERQQRARSGSAAPAKKRKYIYYDQLSFLDPSMDLRPTQSNLTERETGSDSEALIDLVGEEVAGPSSHPSSGIPPATSSVAPQDPATTGQEAAPPPTATPVPVISQDDAGNSSSPTVPLETSPQPAVNCRHWGP
ncbi:uncharacterized protein [Ranitomeya imitator]|uniref:uncharacterized protein n=1 Tax=Ranitomeya imitator TaxID=111125 RepID=UPI0037E7DC1A